METAWQRHRAWQTAYDTWCAQVSTPMQRAVSMDMLNAVEACWPALCPVLASRVFTYPLFGNRPTLNGVAEVHKVIHQKYSKASTTSTPSSIGSSSTVTAAAPPRTKCIECSQENASVTCVECHGDLCGLCSSWIHDSSTSSLDLAKHGMDLDKSWHHRRTLISLASHRAGNAEEQMALDNAYLTCETQATCRLPFMGFHDRQSGASVLYHLMVRMERFPSTTLSDEGSVVKTNPWTTCLDTVPTNERLMLAWLLQLLIVTDMDPTAEYTPSNVSYLRKNVCTGSTVPFDVLFNPEFHDDDDHDGEPATTHLCQVHRHAAYWRFLRKHYVHLVRPRRDAVVRGTPSSESESGLEVESFHEHWWSMHQPMDWYILNAFASRQTSFTVHSHPLLGRLLRVLLASPRPQVLFPFVAILDNCTVDEEVRPSFSSYASEHGGHESDRFQVIRPRLQEAVIHDFKTWKVLTETIPKWKRDVLETSVNPLTMAGCFRCVPSLDVIAVQFGHSMYALKNENGRYESSSKSSSKQQQQLSLVQQINLIANHLSCIPLGMNSRMSDTAMNQFQRHILMDPAASPASPAPSTTTTTTTPTSASSSVSKGLDRLQERMIVYRASRSEVSASLRLSTSNPLALAAWAMWSILLHGTAGSHLHSTFNRRRLMIWQDPSHVILKGACPAFYHGAEFKKRRHDDYDDDDYDSYHGRRGRHALPTTMKDYAKIGSLLTAWKEHAQLGKYSDEALQQHMKKVYDRLSVDQWTNASMIDALASIISTVDTLTRPCRQTNQNMNMPAPPPPPPLSPPPLDMVPIFFFRILVSHSFLVNRIQHQRRPLHTYRR